MSAEHLAKRVLQGRMMLSLTFKHSLLLLTLSELEDERRLKKNSEERGKHKRECLSTFTTFFNYKILSVSL